MPLIDRITTVIIQPVILFLIGLATVFFLYGVMEYIANSSKPEQRQTGAQHMLWGIIGLAITLMAYGLVQVVGNTVNAIGS